MRGLGKAAVRHVDMIMTGCLLAAALFMIALAQPPQPWETVPAERPLPPLALQDSVEREGARIWYGSLGKGAPVILLHGGMASSRSWGTQVPALVAAGYRVILIDSRGHGRSTLGGRPLSYELMAGDVLAVMDRLGLEKSAIVGWSDGAIIALVLAMRHGERLSHVLAFGANMDQHGVRADASRAPILKQLMPRLAADYAALSPIPEGFALLREAVKAMQERQPDYKASDLAAIRGPAVMIAGAAHDEFIAREHQAYLARTIPGATLQMFADASHFAPWQQPDAFNRTVIAFLGERHRAGSRD